MKIRPAVVLLENNTVMLLRYSYSGKDVYQFPGGNMEAIESIEETLVRELEEELHLSIQIKKLILSAQVINTKKQQATLHCLFAGTIVAPSRPVINPEQTSALEVVWMSVSKLDTLNLYPSVGKKLKEILQEPTPAIQYLGVIDQPWF